MPRQKSAPTGSASPRPRRNAATRCGTIALIGAPNAGKSTLLNTLLGTKLSIVSPKAQTTRTRITGILTEGRVQMIFLDVPGIFQAKRSFERAMVKSATAAAAEADLLLVLHDARKPVGDETATLLRQLSAQATRDGKLLLVALNKIDAVAEKSRLLQLAAWFAAVIPQAQIFMISARTSDGVAQLKSALGKALPKAAHRHEADALTNLPMRALAAELTREQCFRRLQQELPYSVTVETEKFETRRDGSMVIHQNILVQNERQKTIVVGAKGAVLREIGASARREISRLGGAPCHLYLHVKITPDWKDRPEILRDIFGA